MYRFLLRPRWIASHLLVLALVVTMVNLGLWQLRRLHAKQDRNAAVTAQTALPPASLREIAQLTPAQAKYRRVTVTGRFAARDEVAIKNRPLNGAPGRQIVTPLVTDDGQTVLVLRGWVPQSVGDTTAPFEAIDPGAGAVTVSGWAMVSEPAPAVGSGRVMVGDAEASRIDVAAIAEHRGLRTPDVFVQLERRDPAAAASPLVAVPLPPLDEGPHFSYAVQWAIFTLIALIGYPLILRRVARQPYDAGDDDADP